MVSWEVFSMKLQYSCWVQLPMLMVYPTDIVFHICMVRKKSKLYIIVPKSNQYSNGFNLYSFEVISFCPMLVPT